MKFSLKRLRPDSLFGQLLLLLCLGIALLQGINLVVIDNIQENYVRQTHEDRVRVAFSRYIQLAPHTPKQRAEIIADIDRLQEGGRWMERPQEGGHWNVTVTLHPTLSPWDNPGDSTYILRTTEILQDLCTIKGIAPLPKIQVRIFNKPPTSPVESYVSAIIENTGSHRFPLMEVAMQFDDGTWMSVMQSIMLNDTSIIWMQRIQLLAVAALLALVLVKVTRLLLHLSQAAEQFGNQPEIMKHLPECGTREVREVTRSFNRMRQMIHTHLAERDRMLAAMAHDLRTPLTRIQLRLESVEPEGLRNKLTANCQEIQSIVDQGMELARSLHTSEAPVALDIRAFVQSIVDDRLDEGGKVTFHDFLSEPEKECHVNARPLCLKRCVDNLLSNALRYGDSAEVVLTEKNNMIVLEILDKGPGIPEEELERVFKPYYRLESSRNRNSGGTGLGLAIARNMALLNEAKLSLHNRAEGGLRVVLVIPRKTETDR